MASTEKRLGWRSGIVVLFGVAILILEPAGMSAWAKPLPQAPIVAWSEPRVAWETTGYTTNPTLITDAWGHVHLFFLSTEETDKQNALYHAEVDNPDAEPIDVLTGVGEFRLTADPFGRIHVLALAVGNQMVHTSVNAAEASTAAAWSASEVLGTAAPGIDINAAADGSMHLCYPFEHNVAYQRSDDGGRNWTDPVLVADLVDPAGVATFVRCVSDTTGAVHVSWAEAHPPNFYPPDGVFYTLSVDGGSSWAPSESIAGQHYTSPTLFADPEGLVHLFWQGDVAVGGRYYQQRTAGSMGRWGPTETVSPAGKGGMSGDAFLASDSRGTLHVGMNVDGIYWTSRSTAWSNPVELSASLRDLPNNSGSIERASLSIANGNEIYVAFEFDFKRIYLLSGQSNAPEAVRTPLPDPQVNAMVTPDVQPVPTTYMPNRIGANIRLTPSLAASEIGSLMAGDTGIRPNLAAYLGASLAIAVVALAVWHRKRSRYRRRDHIAPAPSTDSRGT